MWLGEERQKLIFRRFDSIGIWAKLEWVWEMADVVNKLGNGYADGIAFCPPNFDSERKKIGTITVFEKEQNSTTIKRFEENDHQNKLQNFDQ